MLACCKDVRRERSTAARDSESQTPRDVHWLPYNIPALINVMIATLLEGWIAELNKVVNSDQRV